MSEFVDRLSITDDNGNIKKEITINFGDPLAREQSQKAIHDSEQANQTATEAKQIAQEAHESGEKTQYSLVPFFYGAVDVDTGSYYPSYEHIRISSRIYINKSELESGQCVFKVNVPNAIAPLIANGVYLGFAYKGNTPVKRIPYLSYDGNVGTFSADNSFDNIIICFAKSDFDEITYDELNNSSIEVPDSLRNQIENNTRGILSADERFNAELPSVFNRINFIYGGISEYDGYYSNFYPDGSYTENRIRIRSERMYLAHKLGRYRVNLRGAGSLKYSIVKAYNGIEAVKNIGIFPSKDANFFEFTCDGTFDNIVVSLKKIGEEEITELEKNSVFAYLQLSEAGERKPYSNLKYCALGDSITYGFIPRNENGYPGQLKSYAKIVSERLGFNFLNYGVSGSTVANVESPMSVRYEQMPNDADIITVLGGTNDQWRGVPIGDMDDRDTTTFYGALHVLCQGLYTKYIVNAVNTGRKKAKIIMITPLKKLDPNKSSLENTIENNADILMPLEPFVNAIKDVAAFYSFPVLDFYNLSYINPHLNRTVKGTTPGYEGYYNPYIVDGTHPTEEGHKIMARVLASYLESIL